MPVKSGRRKGMDAITMTRWFWILREVLVARNVKEDVERGLEKRMELTAPICRL